jgi:hypothetical protein
MKTKREINYELYFEHSPKEPKSKLPSNSRTYHTWWANYFWSVLARCLEQSSRLANL